MQAESFRSSTTASQLLLGVGPFPLSRDQTAKEGRWGPQRVEPNVFKSVHNLDLQSLDLEGTD